MFNELGNFSAQSSSLNEKIKRLISPELKTSNEICLSGVGQNATLVSQVRRFIGGEQYFCDLIQPTHTQGQF